MKQKEHLKSLRVRRLALSGGFLLLLLAACAAIFAAVQSKITQPETPPENTSLLEVTVEKPQKLTVEDIRTVSFSDVADSDPWADCVRYVSFKGIMGGSTLFEPEGFMTRSAAVDALFRMSGEEAPPYVGTYQDVPPESWCSGAVAWAVKAELFDSAGIKTELFRPEDAVTRAELAMLMVRHAGYMAANAKTVETRQDGAVKDMSFMRNYKDGGKLPITYAPYLIEALRLGLFQGMVADTVYPNLPVSRGQAAQALTALYSLESGEPLAAELAKKQSAKKVVSVATANHNAMQEKIEKVAAKYGAVGLQVAVLESGEVTDSFACGWATKYTDPMTADHKMRVASLSKVSVGMAAMLLREQGVIDLDVSIGDYWGFPTENLQYPNSPISIRSLLSHTSSIPMYDYNVSLSRSAVEAKLRGNMNNKLEPGSVDSWCYNNYAFSVMGMTLELAGEDYMDNILDENLWSVMGIDAAFEGGEIEAADKLATIYKSDNSVCLPVSSLMRKRPSAPGATGIFFAGGLIISANDQAKLLSLLANDGTYQGLRLLSEESVALMETRFDQILPNGSYQALPLRSQDNIYGRDRLYYHTGSSYGVYNFMSYDPETGDGIVVLSSGANGAKDGYGIYAVCGNIAEYFYNLTFSPPQEELTEKVPKADMLG